MISILARSFFWEIGFNHGMELVEYGYVGGLELTSG